VTAPVVRTAPVAVAWATGVVVVVVVVVVGGDEVVVVVGGTVDVVVGGGSVVAVTWRTGASAMVTGAGRSAPDVRWEVGPAPPAATGLSGAAEASPLPCRASRGATSRVAQSTNATA